MCSLQSTPLDEIANVRVHSFTDDVITGICKELNIKVPEFTL
jgi:hypothetical protein